MYNTRIAPSPTGDLHLGTLRTAYFNYLAARSTGGKFYLRIDDTDSDRNRPELIDSIYEIFSWCGLDYDRSFKQSERFDRHRLLAASLVEQGKAKILDDDAIELTYFDNIPSEWRDRVLGTIKTDEVQKVILIKRDGNPTYHFSCVVDDIDYGINLVIRGVDHISNTPKQIAIYNALNVEIPLYAHVGLLFLNKGKLSKRHGAASTLYYKQAGYDSDGLLNFLLRLGWGPKKDDQSTKRLPREKALELFLNEGNMKATNVNMDMNLLEAFDRKYKADKKIWRTKEKLT